MGELDDDSMKRLSNNDQIDNEESEDDEAFLSRFYKDRNSICKICDWSQGTVLLPPRNWLRRVQIIIGVGILCIV